jgi:hypothetical protein
MSSTSVRGLPTLFALAGGGALPPTRVVLTGPGGGTFDLVAGPGNTDDRQLVVADVVDYCRLVARRIDPDDLAGSREGDVGMLTDLLRSAQAIAI